MGLHCEKERPHYSAPALAGDYEKSSSAFSAGWGKYCQGRVVPDGFRCAGSPVAQGPAHHLRNPGQSTIGQRLDDRGSRSFGETRTDCTQVEPKRSACTDSGTHAGGKETGGLMLRTT